MHASSSFRRFLSSCFVCCSLVACSSGTTRPTDAATSDAGEQDADTTDGDVIDADMTDVDADMTDAGDFDADMTDAGDIGDAGDADAGSLCPNEGIACYSGEPEKRQVGVCADGTIACSDAGLESCIGEVLPSTELCNELDDDCDVAIDEDFDLTSDEAHCGSCYVACDVGQQCLASQCRWPTEVDCGNGIDDDGDSLQDCLDLADCGNQSCGTGCTCSSGSRKETLCSDRTDNDGDGNADCLDQVDCPAGTPCLRSNGTPGTCQANRTCN